MGNNAFADFLVSIQAKISNQNNTVTVLEKQAVSYRKKAAASNEQVATDLVAMEDDIKNRKNAIENLKAFFIMIKKDWSEVNNRIIGQIV